MATHLDEALTQAGYRSLVIACEGSKVSGELIPTPRWDGDLNDDVRARAQTAHRVAIGQALRRYPVDVIHMHGLDWHRYLPAPGVPLLVTLHLPPAWYPNEALSMRRAETSLVCVSNAQRSTCPYSALPIMTVENGVPVERLHSRVRGRSYVVAMGRVCPEKGLHHAIDAAKRANRPMILAGEVFRYEAHIQYFEREIVPRLDAHRRFHGPVGFARKRRLLSGARCLLAPSLAPETSSLVAMEALACGTPVIAFPAGALPEIIEHGRTGFIVGDNKEMADAIDAVDSIDPQECRDAARRRFSSDRMAQDYMSIYERVSCPACI